MDALDHFPWIVSFLNKYPVLALFVALGPILAMGFTFLKCVEKVWGWFVVLRKKLLAPMTTEQAREIADNPKGVRKSKLYAAGRALTFGLEGAAIDAKRGLECLKAASERGCWEAKAELALAMYGSMPELTIGESNPKAALEFAREASKSPFAKYVLGRGLEYQKDGGGAKKYYKKAFKALRKRSSDPLARFLLGVMRVNGQGTKADRRRATQDYRKSVDLGCAVAANCLAFEYQREQKFRDAKEYFKRSADLGCAAAMKNLGAIYEKEGDFEGAFERYREASGLGHVAASYALGTFYEEGRGCKQDYDNAVRAYQKAVKGGFAQAQYRLALMYEKELGNGANNYPKTHERYEKVRELYEKVLKSAETRGVNDVVLTAVLAATRLGRLYEEGRGVKKEDYVAALKYYEKARELYKKSAKGRDEDAEATLRLAQMRERGRGDKQDCAKAAALYKEIIAKKNADAEVRGDATTQLGRLYEEGRGVESNSKEALRLYNEAAKLGHADGQYRLGLARENGVGCNVDYAKAFECYKQAAAQEHAAATYRLGVFYELGRGIAEDQARAFELFQTAYRLGDVDAEVRVGEMYEYGLGGLVQDKLQAKERYKKADQKGCVAGTFAFGALCAKEGEYELAVQKFEKVVGSKKADDEQRAKAQFNLAQMYEHGVGVERNLAEARRRYEATLALNPSSDVASKTREALARLK